MIRSAPSCLAEQRREEPDGAVSDHRHRRARLHIRRLGREPAGAEDVGGREQARHEIVRGHVARRDQRPVGERHAQPRRLRAAD